MEFAGMPEPDEPAHLDRTFYRSVHFFGQTLDVPLQAAADYIQHISQVTGHPPHVVCMREEFSGEDRNNELAWRLTLVVGDLPTR